MKEILMQTLIVGYGATGILSLVGYWPTIRDLYYHQKPSANISSYILWTLTGGVGFLYSIFILYDLLLRIVLGLNLCACILVLLLRIRLKNNR